MHVDTGHNFAEVIEFRDRRVAELGVQLVVASVQESIDAGRVVEETGPAGQPQPAADRHAARRHRASTASTPCSAAAGATRRRPGPRSASSRSATSSASGTRRTSGPSCGTSTTAGTARASTSACSRSRTGPSSTSGSTSPTRSIELPSIYYAHRREVFRRDGMLLAVTAVRARSMDGEEPSRTMRSASARSATRRCTGAVESTRGDGRARSSPRSPPRGSPSAARPAPTTASPKPAMEDRKREGYF